MAKPNTVFVVSTLTCSQAYTLYEVKEGSDIPTPKQKVVIKGGHGVANKNFITPSGVVTAITEEDAKMLEHDPMFKRHLEKKFVKIVKKNPGVDADKVAAGSLVTSGDKSAPKNKDTVKDGTASTAKPEK